MTANSIFSRFQMRIGLNSASFSMSASWTMAALLNENTLRVLALDGQIDIIGAPANGFVNKTPRICNELGLKCIEAEPIKNVGQYTTSNVHSNPLKPTEEKERQANQNIFKLYHIIKENSTYVK